jgi:RNA polymerase-binding protein DksA
LNTSAGSFWSGSKSFWTSRPKPSTACRPAPATSPTSPTAPEETDRALELRTRDRQRKLVAKIDAALRRIENGEFGYCEVSGEQISLKRLDARPIATMTLEAQEKHERREKVHRDD